MNIAMRQQNGSALIIGLIFLVLLTILGLTAMQTTTLEEKMSGNLRDRSLAFQSAESALRDAEKYILNTSLGPGVAACTGGLCSVGALDWSTYSWDGSKSITYGTSPSPAATPVSPATSGVTVPSVSQQPQYFIEDLGVNSATYPACPGNAHGYRIVARAWGANSNTQVTLESVFAKC